MNELKIRSISDEVAAEVRATLKAPVYGHPVYLETATGYGPCRVCLRKFVPGVERRILFTHDPFYGIEAFPLPGPVYIHEVRCEPYTADGGFPHELRDLGLTLNAYGCGRILRAQAHVPPAGLRFDADQRMRVDLDDAIAELLDRPDVAYIHVRNTEAGCYLFTAQRQA
ncbi:MAG: DUF1203 domain-containing protein [Candidatus Eremiobacteraeota bacterium]|nr:DUF1203 domain-containing protein [Candidatus Eremiobacteraeota bacterium]MBC5828430.1 DUF1203 domain-containing protein [Candidatus Eremiobacteraeota bacterium]